MALRTDDWIPEDYTNDLPAVEVAVWRYDPDSFFGGPRLVRLPSLECLEVRREEGPSPSVARFRYRLGDGNPGSPQTLDEALVSYDPDFAGPGILRPGDRLLVMARKPDGDPRDLASWEPLFEGQPYIFEGQADGNANIEEATLVALSYTFRLFDDPVPGMILRDATRPRTPGADVETRLPAIFNVDGQANCTAVKTDTEAVGSPDWRHPVFMDPLAIRKDAEIGDYWTLEGAAAYLIYAHLARLAPEIRENFWIPTRDELERILVARIPKPGVILDPDDPITYDPEPISVANVPIKGRAWPEVLHNLLADKGFGMVWDLIWDPASERIIHSLRIQVLQSGLPQDLYLQPRGSMLDVGASNVNAMHFGRDLTNAANQIEVTGAPAVVEASFVLACGFPSTMADGSESALDTYCRNHPDFRGVRDLFRLYQFGEIGEPCYRPNTTTPISDPGDLLEPVLKVSPFDPYVRRPRPPLGHLASRDDDDRPRRPLLCYSTTYTGPIPAVWDGADPDQWHAIQGGYELLKDRLGIWIDVDDPTSWQIGDDAEGTAVVLNAVQDQLGITGKPWTLMLTCAVETDAAAGFLVDRQPRAALPQAVTRWVDASDRYRKDVVIGPSWYNQTTDDVDIRNDNSRAMAEATALRDASDAGRLAGPVVVPRFTMAYEPLFRIRGINGRNIGLRTDGMGPLSQPVYPLVRTITWRLKDDQQTVLTLSDANSRNTHRRGY